MNPAVAALRDAVVVLAWFAVAAVVAAVVWWQVTPLPVFTRTRQGTVMNQVQLGDQVAIDGWYFLLAAGLGLVSGVALTAWRRRDAVLTVALVTVGAVGAGWLAIVLGRWLGPPDPHTLLGHLRVGQHAMVQLELTSRGEWLVWPITALLGALGVLWGTSADGR
jgi:CHASE2 domain-containing sensor protein